MYLNIYTGSTKTLYVILLHIWAVQINDPGFK